MGRTTREAVCVASLILAAVASAAYIAERVSLRSAFESGMTEFWEVYHALRR